MTQSGAAPPTTTRVRVVVATTVFLSFISFWRAAAIVLADLGSSAFYAGGIAEQAAGKAAPWFILGVMLFSFAVRAIYIESSVMFVRGGVYRVVKEAMGPTFGKLSVSALLFDYVLTGPISGVSAGQYIVGLVNDVAAARRLPAEPAAERHRRRPGDRRHPLLLAPQHRRAARVEQRRAPDRPGHDRDGRRAARLGRAHAPRARRPPAAAAHAGQHPLLGRRAGLAAGNAASRLHRRRGDGRPRPFVPGDERLGIAGAGLPRDRTSEGASTSGAPAWWSSSTAWSSRCR